MNILKTLRMALNVKLKSKILIIALLLISLASISSIFLYNYAIAIERPFPKNNGIEEREEKSLLKPTIYFGVVSRFSAHIIYKGYQPLMDYLTANTPFRFELKLSNTYGETVEQLVNNEVSVAFLGSFIYLKSREATGIVPILKPLNENGEPYFHSVVISKTETPIYSLLDLKNKKLALPSKQSFSGIWPIFKLKQLQIGISELDSLHHFAHHHTVVHQVLKNIFDAGVVKDRVAKEYMSSGIRIIDYSMPIPGSPIVVSKNTKKEIADVIVTALLNIDLKKEKYRELIKNWDKEFAYGFVVANANDYDELDKFLEKVKENSLIEK